MAEQDLEPAAPGASDEATSGSRGELTTLTGAQALERLRAGRPLENACVEKLVFSGEFPHPVRLRNCRLVKPRFHQATFNGELTLANCTVEHPHFAGPTTVAGDLSLRASTVQGAQLMHLTVKGTFTLDHLTARGGFALIACTFEGTVRFWDASFHNWLNVKRSTFRREADFRSLSAQKGITMAGCRFEGPALFRGASVAMKCDLGDCHFENLIDFSRAKLNDYVYLEGISQGPQQRFAFGNTLGERILIRTEQLQGRVESEQAGHHDQAAHEYAFLKRAFGALHRYEQEDWAFYRFKVNQRRARPRSWLRPWTRLFQLGDWLLLDVGCGYGANPMRAVRAAAVIMLGFALLYMTGIEHFYVDAAKRPFPDEPLTSWPNRLMIGTTVSVSVFTSGVGGIRELARDWMNVPLMVEAMLGTLLWGLFIVSFSRKVIR